MKIKHRNPNSTTQMIVDNTGSNSSLPTILYFVFKILGILASLLPIYLGYKLFVLGVTGKASIVINSPDVSGQLLNAAPGLFFAVGGIIALIAAIFKGIKYEQT